MGIVHPLSEEDKVTISRGSSSLFLNCVSRKYGVALFKSGETLYTESMRIYLDDLEVRGIHVPDLGYVYIEC